MEKLDLRTVIVVTAGRHLTAKMKRTPPAASVLLLGEYRPAKLLSRCLLMQDSTMTHSPVMIILDANRKRNENHQKGARLNASHKKKRMHVLQEALYKVGTSVFQEGSRNLSIQGRLDLCLESSCKRV